MMTRRRGSSMPGAGRAALRWAALSAVSALALLSLPAGQALATTAVGAATIQASSLSASATEVSYTVNFDSTSALTGGKSTVTLAAPSGTKLPTATCYLVSDDANGTLGCGAVTVTGTTAKITLPSAVNVAAGDSVTVLVTGVDNPTSAGAKTLKVSTSADTTAVSLPYTLVAERSVSEEKLQVSSSSASAAGVSYSVTFRSVDRLSRSSQVIVKFPTGTTLAPGGCSQVDFIDDTNGTTGCPGVTNAGTTATVSNLIANPGDLVTIVFYGMTSPSSTGTQDVTLQTTSDPLPVTLAYSLQPKRSVSDPFLQLSSYTAGASGVNWAIGFVAPDRLTDSGAGNSSSTVIIKAPTGTVFPAGGCSVYFFIDASPAGSQGPENGCTSATVTGSSVAITAGFDTNPGNTVFVVIKGVKNPAAMSSVSVSTSADPGAVSVPLTSQTRMSATGQISSTSASAKEVSYAGSFQSTGALTGGTSTVKLTSAGAVFPLCSASGQYTLIDDTTGVEAGLCPVGGSVAGATITLAYNGATTKAGDEITVLAYGVANSAKTGSGTFSVTSSSAGGASLPIDLTARTSVGSPVLSLASYSAAAADVAYSATFTVANGFMVSGAGDDFSTIAVKAAAGTRFPASGYATVINDATGAVSGSSFTGSAATATVRPGSGGNLGAGPGDEISVIVFGAANSSSAGADTVSISTTSDPGAVSAAYPLTAQTSVADDIVQLSSRTPGASGVTYSFTFRTTNALVTSTWSDSTITVKLPAGTGMPPAEDVAVTDDTMGQACGGVSSSSGTTATVVLSTGSCPGELGAGDVVTLLLTGVKNSASLSGASISLSTSSDPAAVITALP